MRDMLKEFRAFLMQGSLIALAVAFIMAVAFGSVVKSLIEDLVTPLIAMVVGKPDFSGLTFSINGASFRYGAFLTVAIAFVSTAAAVFFLIVKPVSVVTARRTRPVADAAVEAPSDEERRHQEILEALRALRAD